MPTTGRTMAELRMRPRREALDVGSPSPDSEATIAHETNSIFLSFAYHMYSNEMTTAANDPAPAADDLPSIPPELKDVDDQPTT